MSRSDRNNRSKSPESSLIDGFVRRTPATPGSTSFDKKAPRPRATLTVDDFKRRDGFQPRSRDANPRFPDGSATGRKSKYNNLDAGDSTLEMEALETPKRKIRQQKSGRFRRAMRKSTAMLVMVFLLGAGFLLGAAYLRATSIFQGGDTALALSDEIDPSQLKGEGDGRVNILLMGRGGPGHTAPDLTDTIILASIDPIQKEAGLVSIPRDFYVQAPGGGSTKINAVYSNAKQYALYQGKSETAAADAGIQAIETTIEGVTGLPVHYYAMIDFRGFEKAINVVDGIDINVKTPVYEDMIINNVPYQLNVSKGWQHFNGKKALAYSRSRHTSARGDFDRSERQREVIVALQNKVMTLGTFGNPVRMAQLFDTFGKHIRTNLSVDDVMRLYSLGGEIDSSQVKSVGLVDPPNNYITTSMIDGLSVVIPTEGLYQYNDIHHFLRNKFKDGFIRKENPHVLVLNGTTTPGLAEQQKKVLLSYGYKVPGIGDAPSKNYSTTKLIDMRDGAKKYTKRYLELRYKTTATTELPKGIDTKDADFVVILGRNETVTY